MILVNDINCTTLNMVFSELPSIPKPIRRIEEKYISGRDGVYIVDKGSYENIEITLNGHAECTRTELIDYFGNYGEIKFTKASDRFWNYRVINLDINEILDDGILIMFSIVLSLEPYKYLDSGKNKITNTSFDLNNLYNTNAYPILKINGSGLIRILKNSRETMRIENVQNYVIVDCMRDVIHRDNISYENNTTGDIFYLDAKKLTRLTFNGNISSVELTPNWREV